MRPTDLVPTSSQPVPDDVTSTSSLVPPLGGRGRGQRHAPKTRFQLVLVPRARPAPQTHGTWRVCATGTEQRGTTAGTRPTASSVPRSHSPRRQPTGPAWSGLATHRPSTTRARPPTPTRPVSSAGNGPGVRFTRGVSSASMPPSRRTRHSDRPRRLPRRRTTPARRPGRALSTPSPGTRPGARRAARRTARPRRHRPEGGEPPMTARSHTRDRRRQWAHLRRVADRRSRHLARRARRRKLGRAPVAPVVIDWRARR